MVLGRNPVRELWERSKVSSSLSLVMEEGTDPENLLDRRVKLWRLTREEIEEGIIPEKSLSARSRVASWVSWEISGVSLPE